MKQSNKLYISIIIGFVVLGVAFIIYKNAKIERYEVCKKEANKKSTERWNNNCSKLGKEDNCLLPVNIAMEPLKNFSLNYPRI